MVGGIWVVYDQVGADFGESLLVETVQLDPLTVPPPFHGREGKTGNFANKGGSLTGDGILKSGDILDPCFTFYLDDNVFTSGSLQRKLCLLLCLGWGTVMISGHKLGH